MHIYSIPAPIQFYNTNTDKIVMKMKTVIRASSILQFYVFSSGGEETHYENYNF